MEEKTKCLKLNAFMKTQVDIVNKHIDEHKWLRKINDKEEAVASFVHDYGWLIREMYCTRVCELKGECPIANELNKNGDLLKNKL